MSIHHVNAQLPHCAADTDKLLEFHVREMLRLLGYDSVGEMARTPHRVAKFFRDFTSKIPFEFTLFDSDSDEMVIQNRIPVFSLCAHHLLPIIGTASVAYIPNGSKIVGLSKLARVVQHFASDLQNQERLTKQVGEFIFKHTGLRPTGVGVSIRAMHMCMSGRGVKAHDAVTRTQFLAGEMKLNPACRAEFLDAIEHD